MDIELSFISKINLGIKLPIVEFSARIYQPISMLFTIQTDQLKL